MPSGMRTVVNWGRRCSAGATSWSPSASSPPPREVTQSTISSAFPLGVPPGLAPISVSDRARERFVDRSPHRIAGDWLIEDEYGFTWPVDAEVPPEPERKRCAVMAVL